MSDAGAAPVQWQKIKFRVISIIVPIAGDAMSRWIEA
jgi:hypothetical protein